MGILENNLYEQGFIVAPHLGTLGFSIGRGGEIRSIYSYFLSSAAHLICSAFLSLGGIYHAIFGRETLDFIPFAFVFAFEFQDRRRMTTILGVHLGIISLAALSFWSYGVIS